MVDHIEDEQATRIVSELRNLDLLIEVIRRMKISDPIGILQIKKCLKPEFKCSCGTVLDYPTRPVTKIFCHNCNKLWGTE